MYVTVSESDKTLPRSFVSVLAQNRLTCMWETRKRNSSMEKDPRGPNSSRYVLLLGANYLGTSVSKQQSRLPKQSGSAPNAVRHTSTFKVNQYSI